jgi:hypothetical protein
VTIEDIIIKRGIKEILHFTTNLGFVGILDSECVKPRKILPDNRRLEHILKLNCPDRSRDLDWHNYVNLSITCVNKYIFGISKKKWHKNDIGWWCILSFRPEILTHSGVVFCTTNNAYSNVVKRGYDNSGLEALFANQIVEYESGTVARRLSSTPSNQPTSKQAEVLYPGELSLDYLQKIYVNESDNASAVEGQWAVCSEAKSVECIVKPELF